MAKKAVAQNSAKLGPPVGKPFVKGDERINRGGRPKGQMALVRELLALGPKALENLKAALEANEKWATELVVNAFTIKELIAAALLEKDSEPDSFDWEAVADDDFKKVISIARKAQAKTAGK